MKKTAIIIFLCFTFLGYSQNLNEYKYALLPSKFKFQKEKNQYNVNTIVRMILEKNKFETYSDDENLPDDFARENCNKVYVDLDVINNMFVTKVKINLKDCKNNVLFTSSEGKSKDKDNTAAFLEALREASTSLDAQNHKYEPTLKKDSEAPESSIQKNSSNQGKPIVLFAKKTTIGFDLVTANSEIVFITLKPTTLKEVYFATRQNTNGIVFKNNEKWFFEYYENNQMLTEALNLQF